MSPIFDIILDTNNKTIKYQERDSQPIPPENPPLIMRALYHGHFKYGKNVVNDPPEVQANHIIDIEPADLYVWTQGPDPNHVETMQTLRSRGKIVYWYMNMHSTRTYAWSSFSYPHWEKITSLACKLWQLMLKDSNKNPVYYRWYSKGWIIDWSKVTDAIMDWMIDGLGFWGTNPGPFEFDVVNPKVYSWMLLENDEAILAGKPDKDLPYPQTAIDSWLDQKLYDQNLRKFMDKWIGHKQRHAFLNVNPVRRDYYTNLGYTLMQESANTRNFSHWAGIFEYWKNNPKAVLELDKVAENTEGWRKVIEATDWWLNNGGIIWADNEHWPLDNPDAAVVKYLKQRREEVYGY